ncbi:MULTISPECIES: hypothetical protein [unclassified Luteibacter]|uniref:hypothetical protein n=1 Tax=Luteibacter sp. PvP019 TaxID=3156436 RepID=UPI003397D64C
MTFLISTRVIRLADDRAHFSDGAGNIPGRGGHPIDDVRKTCMRRRLLSGASLSAGIDAPMHKSGGGFPGAFQGSVGKIDDSANSGQMRQPRFVFTTVYA